MIIAIDKSIMNKMPQSCKECPLTYLDTGDDAFFGANERRCVLDDSCVDGMMSERAYDCPLVEAIPIPKGATNGDIFLSTHKDVVATVIKKKGNLFDVVQLRHEGDTIPFAEVYLDWWNAPYKEAEE